MFMINKISEVQSEKIIKEKDEVEVVTFGCRLNTYESEVMKKHAQEAGMKNVIIVNTCAVTAEAERQGRQSIRKLRKKNPDSKIIVTGCAAQVHAEDFSNMEEVSVVIGNDEKMNSQTYHDMQNPFIGHNQKIKVNDIMEVKEVASHMITGFDGHTRAFVQVQNGCDHRCTFCIIPFGRGNSRSVAVGEIVSQIQLLVKQGYKEVVLTGVDISSYGGDLPGKPTLGQMVKRLLGLVPELPRLRISSIDCIEIDEDLFNVIATENRLMPHMHLSLQSGDNMILKRMARRHSREDIIELIDRLRECRADMVIGADIIAGFPTETNEMFDNTLDIIERCNVTWIHAFPYSERDGTPAARIPNQVPVSLRKERATRLREVASEMQKKLYDSLVGTEQNVLVEKNNTGYTEQYALVRINTDVTEGQIIQVKIVESNDKHLIAEVV